MRFGRLDLNLLVTLDALLDERSVTKAANRLCLSQSATSSALGRLRNYYGDELLVLKGRKMFLTARAEGLIEPVRDVLEQIRTTVAAEAPHDERSRRGPAQAQGWPRHYNEERPHSAIGNIPPIMLAKPTGASSPPDPGKAENSRPEWSNVG